MSSSSALLPRHFISMQNFPDMLCYFLVFCAGEFMTSIKELEIDVSLQGCSSIRDELFLYDNGIVNTTEDMDFVAGETVIALVFDRKALLLRKVMAQTRPSIPLALTQDRPKPHTGHEGMDEPIVGIHLPRDSRRHRDIGVGSRQDLDTRLTVRRKLLGESIARADLP